MTENLGTMIFWYDNNSVRNIQVSGLISIVPLPHFVMWKFELQLLNQSGECKYNCYIQRMGEAVLRSCRKLSHIKETSIKHFRYFRPDRHLNVYSYQGNRPRLLRL